ncbi:MAG: hypothetical protein OCD01_12720 [Fibrobacterales bacterium]
MKFVLVCDNKAIINDLTPFVTNDPSHELEVYGYEHILDGNRVPQADAYIFESRGWNKNHSLFKYFDILEDLDDGPFIGVSKRNVTEFLKGRLGKKDVMFYLPTNQETFNKNLESFQAIKGKMDLLKAAMR